MAEEKHKILHSQYSDLSLGQGTVKAGADTIIIAEVGEDFLPVSVKVLAETIAKGGGLSGLQVAKSRMEASATTVVKVRTGKRIAISVRQRKEELQVWDVPDSLPF